MSSVLWDTVWVSDANGQLVGDWAPSTLVGQVDGGMLNVDPLATAVILALFTDARLPDGMVDGHNFTEQDQVEWHGNTFGMDPGEEVLGSLLWTLKRMVLNEQTARLAEHYAAVALQTLIRQRKVAYFDISSLIDKKAGKITLRITAYGVGPGARETRRFFADLWPLR